MYEEELECLEEIREIPKRIVLLVDDLCRVLSDLEQRKYNNLYIKLLYRAVRFYTLALSDQLLNFKKLMFSLERWLYFFEERQPARKRTEEMIENLLSRFLEMHVAFTFAEARLMGLYPPCEGILIIKEYKKEE